MIKLTKYIIVWVIALCQTISTAQNCNVFLYQKDTLQYEACLIAEDAYQYYQYSREYQEILDKAIKKCRKLGSTYMAHHAPPSSRKGPFHFKLLFVHILQAIYKLGAINIKHIKKVNARHNRYFIVIAVVCEELLFGRP